MANTDLITLHFAIMDVCEPEPNPVMAGAGGGTKKKGLCVTRGVYSHCWASAAVSKVLAGIKFIPNTV